MGVKNLHLFKLYVRMMVCFNPLVGAGLRGGCDPENCAHGERGAVRRRRDRADGIGNTGQRDRSGASSADGMPSPENFGVCVCEVRAVRVFASWWGYITVPVVDSLRRGTSIPTWRPRARRC